MAGGWPRCCWASEFLEYHPIIYMNALEKSFNSARKRRKSNASAHPPAAINNEISSALFSWRAAAKLLSRLREKRRWRRRRERAVFFILQRRRLSIHCRLLQLFRQFINNLRTSKFSAEQLGRFSPQALIYRRTKFHSSISFCIHSKAAHLTGKVLKVESLL